MEKDGIYLSIHNGPAWLSQFIGREKEKAEAASLLQHTRLLTLIGPGGCGKTRLALEIAKAVCSQYRDDTWLVELADLLEPERIAQAAAASFGLLESSARSPMQRLVEHLREKHALLVLDNCEHLIEACAQFVHALLTACPELTVLATSREPLHIAGENTWVVPPLSLPEWRPGQPLDALLQSEAVRLFAERARAAHASFNITTENAETVLRICQQVDGIPLAIELAAARVNALTVAEIARQVGDTFRWLENSDRLAPPRQQTLAAAVEWSHNLLTREEQRLFRRLAVFIGGFDLPAAEAVGGDDQHHKSRVIALLAHLVEKSFVTRCEGDGEESRYRMLEIIRQFGLEKLSQAEEEQVIRGRHLRWCMDFAKKSRAGVLLNDRGKWVNRVEDELPNLRQAMHWAVREGGMPNEAHILANQLGQFWQLRGYLREGLSWNETLLTHHDGVSPSVLAETFDMASFFAQHLWDFERGKQYMEEALALWRETGNDDGIAWGLSMLGWIYERAGDYEQAQRLADESITLFETRRSQRHNRYGVYLLACDLAFIRGEYGIAEQHLKKGMDISQQVGDQMAYARRLTRLALITMAKGSLNRAQRLLKQSLDANQNSGDRWNMAMILVAVVHLNTVQGRLKKAARCLGAVQVFLDWFGSSLWPLDQLLYEKDLQFVESGMSEAEYQAAIAEGRQQGLDVEQATVFASAMLEDPTNQARGKAAQADAIKLTPREREIAALISRGMNNNEIAQTLFLGVRTIEAHVTHILNKLDFSSRTQIAVWAVQKGIAGN